MVSPSLHVIMLAAGMGNRLSGDRPNFPPKCLLEISGKSLLARHLDILENSRTVSAMTLVVGYESAQIEDHIASLETDLKIQFVRNDQFDRGSNLSLWHASEQLNSGDPVLFMDADVLYSPSILTNLVSPTERSVVPYDSSAELGDEPVKVCFMNGRIVDFGKEVTESYDRVGEWPGFMRFSPETAASIANKLRHRIENGHNNEPYEDVFRDVILSAPDGAFEFYDIAGLPWIEIDFPEDLVRAERVIAPQLDK